MKHALRNLIKAGHPRALKPVGVTLGARVRLQSFDVTPRVVRLGQTLKLNTTLVSSARQPHKLVADYAIHYVKKNGATSGQVFKLRTLELPGGAELVLEKTRPSRTSSPACTTPGGTRRNSW